MSSVQYLCATPMYVRTCVQYMVPVYVCPVYGTYVPISSVWYLHTYIQCMVPVYLPTYVYPVYGTCVRTYVRTYVQCTVPIMSSTQVLYVLAGLQWCYYSMVSIVYTCTYAVVVVVQFFEGEIPWIPHSLLTAGRPFISC